jgi:hypothetical protein
MIEILEYIKKLDESGNYRLADKLDNEVRKIYAQAVNQVPGISGYAGFVLNQLVQNKIKPENEDTDTLSPTKNTDATTLNKQMNNLIAQMANLQRDNKKFKANQDTLPSLEGKIGKVSELSDNFNTKITDISNNTAQNTKGIEELEATVNTLEQQ